MSELWRQDTNAGVTHPLGFQASALRSGLKSSGDDMVLIAVDVAFAPAVCAGVFTTNLVKASCVTWSEKVVQGRKARAILCNAGNANACNGPQGDIDVRDMAQIAADSLNADAGSILIAQTGVIGHPLPMEKVAPTIPKLAARLTRGAENDEAVACAIMTTDLSQKTVAVTAECPCWSGPVRIGAVCKGSGMIAPNMATMLCFVTTDVSIEAATLQGMLSRVTESTFNRMTVDGDTSTNDMILALASGASGVNIDTPEASAAFEHALFRVCLHLAREVARDGEGATKIVDIVVTGARTEHDAARIGRTVAESPLVKTALFGNDPNWGRILAAAGRSGGAFNPELIEVLIGEQCVCREGRSIPFDADCAREYLQGDEVKVTIDLHEGEANAIFYTCDFSYDYVRINAEYHT